MRTHRFQIVIEQYRHLDRLLLRQVFRTLQQAPSRVNQNLLVAVSFQLLRLGGANVIKCPVQFCHYVVPFDNVHGVTGSHANDVQVLFPHMAADVLQRRSDPASQRAKELVQRQLGAFRTHPQQPLHAGIDLIDESRVATSLLPGKFVDSQGLHITLVAMSQTPPDGILHRAKHRVSARVEDARDLLPGRTPCPTRQKPAVRCRLAALADPAGACSTTTLQSGHATHRIPYTNSR